ncbi:universal stress protein [Enterococcus sp. 669A]|uniref:Universal stress protein n=1 Tax=Candidatus Enterococcus moelleringii TaxID=2815325 RepID=A0ABS3LD20_9ENTE|nr:universal stress protein [Enterococcus sp. 669A]MBO1306933.1 universal stress protein [Enterococcus sp. 669A]
MREEYKNILVAVDGSEQAKKTFEEAVEVAKRNKGMLTILSVVDNKYSFGDPSFINDALKFHMNNAEIEIDTLLSGSEELPEKYETSILSGSPKRKIVEYAKNHNIDLIMLGSTGVGAIEKAIIGSTSSYVVNHASCNVMVVK